MGKLWKDVALRKARVITNRDRACHYQLPAVSALPGPGDWLGPLRRCRERRRLMQLPVRAVGQDELLVGAALHHRAVVEDDDLVDLVEPVKLMGDEQGRAAG